MTWEQASQMAVTIIVGGGLAAWMRGGLARDKARKRASVWGGSLNGSPSSTAAEGPLTIEQSPGPALDPRRITQSVDSKSDG